MLHKSEKSAPRPSATQFVGPFGAIDANSLIPKICWIRTHPRYALLQSPHIHANRDTIGLPVSFVLIRQIREAIATPKNSPRRDTMRHNATQIGKIGTLFLSPTPPAGPPGGIQANALIPKIRRVRLSSFFPAPNAQQGTTTHKRAQLSEITKRYAVLLALAAVCPGAQPVQLTEQPQKFRTFYSLSDPRLPPALKQPGATLRALASDGAVWCGTPHGLTRVDPKAAPRDRSQYFAGKRYLPDDEVRQLAADNAGGMWVRTRTGVSHIELRPMTLSAKAALFEQRIHARHDRHGLVSPSNLRVPGDLSTNQMRDDDNDGLWTSMYAAAECFRYAVTHSPEALANATRSTEAVLFLEEVAGKRGFPARSYIRKGEPMPDSGEWHWTPDGQYYWKGDTSSDEIVGHFFLYGVAMDLLTDAALKKHIAETAARIMDHILDHGYYLIDVTGKPTTWGRWSPAYFKQEPGDSALNSMELLSFLQTAAHITGSARYLKEYRKAAIDLGYARQAARYKELRQEINYSDEELAMLSFYNLFRYETNGELLDRYYRPALNEWWENIVREENPLWTFIYTMARPDTPVDMQSAVRTLYRMPIDTIEWTVKNSNRAELMRDATLVPPDERPVMKWNSNPFDIDGGSDGRGEDDGAAFLLPYWMGRYHGYLHGN
jgi:hypothetical protein